MLALDIRLNSSDEDQLIALYRDSNPKQALQVLIGSWQRSRDPRRLASALQLAENLHDWPALKSLLAEAEGLPEAQGSPYYWVARARDVYKRQVVPPANVVRHDEDDPYLVVAADKGTATFSDIANGIAAEYGFWLGDAFASGGSAGYDHKGMGITAKGAWVSVQRHFRERGIDVQKDNISVIGIGDMAGDVFGNGLLMSDKLQLVAAFNHMHIRCV